MTRSAEDRLQVKTVIENFDGSIHVHFILNHMYLYWLFSSVTTRRESIVDGMRTIALKLEFGAFHNQIFERFFHFHHPYF